MDTTEAEELDAWPEHLDAADAMFLKGEGEPRTRGTGHLVYILDSVPDWDRFVAVWDRASRVLPPLRKRIIAASGPGRLPTWRDDPDFDLRFHVRRLSVPAPHTLREVFDYAEADGMELHDPGRPLWQVTLLEDLEGDRAALLLKFHHSWMDGNSSIQLGRIVYETERDGDLAKSMPAPPPVVTERARQLGRLATMPLRVLRGAGVLAVDAGRLAGRVVRDPNGSFSEAAELLASTRRLLAPITADPSPLLAGRSPASRFDVVDVPFEDLRLAAKAAGCTLNDAYLAGVTGGIRRYHEHFGVPIDAVPMGMPMSTRADDDRSLGNQVSATMLAAPIAIVDPRERMQRFHDLVLAVRYEAAMDKLAGLAGILVHLPDAWVQGPLANMVKVDFGVSQVRGLIEPSYLAGSQIMRSYGFGPHTSLAAFIGMNTHLDSCCIGIHSDPAAITDPELFAACMREGFEEVLALGTSTTTAAETAAKAPAKAPSKRVPAKTAAKAPAKRAVAKRATPRPPAQSA